MKYSMIGQEKNWFFSAGDCLIEVTSMAGLYIKRCIIKQILLKSCLVRLSWIFTFKTELISVYSEIFMFLWTFSIDLLHFTYIFSIFNCLDFYRTWLYIRVTRRLSYLRSRNCLPFASIFVHPRRLGGRVAHLFCFLYWGILLPVSML